MVDLNHLISPASGWVLTSANGLNDSGSIVGTGLVNGQQRAFLLTEFSGVDSDAPLATVEGNIDHRRQCDAHVLGSLLGSQWNQRGID